MLVFHVHNKHAHERLILNQVEILCKVKGGGGGGGGQYEACLVSR